MTSLTTIDIASTRATYGFHARFLCSLKWKLQRLNHSLRTPYVVKCPAVVNPNAKSVTSDSLSARWILEWTTEREILFLMEKGLPGKPSGPVQQDIDVDTGTLSNRMLFGEDALFEVASSIQPEVSGELVQDKLSPLPKLQLKEFWAFLN